MHISNGRHQIKKRKKVNNDAEGSNEGGEIYIMIQEDDVVFYSPGFLINLRINPCLPNSAPSLRPLH